MYRGYDLAILEAELTVVRRLRDDARQEQAGRAWRVIGGLALLGGGLYGMAWMAEEGLTVATNGAVALFCLAASFVGLRLVSLGLRSASWDRAERLLDGIEERISAWPQRERYTALDGVIVDGTGRVLDLAEVVSRLNGGPVAMRGDSL